MNFQAIEQANGNDVTINAIATALGNTEYTKQKGTPFMKCKLTDANGITKDVTIWQGKGHPIPGSMQGQTLSFNLNCKVSGQYTNYGGFWNASAQVQPIAPPQAAQGSQQAAGTPNARNKADGQPDWDAIAEGKVRHGIVCAYIQGGRDPEIESVKYWTYFVMYGYEQPQQPQPVQSEEILF